MPPRILKITKHAPHGETVTEIELPDDPREPTPREGIDVTPTLTVLAHTRNGDGAHDGFHVETIDLTGLAKIELVGS